MVASACFTLAAFMGLFGGDNGKRRPICFFLDGGGYRVLGGYELWAIVAETPRNSAGLCGGPICFLAGSRVARRICALYLRAGRRGSLGQFGRCGRWRRSSIYFSRKYQLPRTQWSEVARLESSRLFIAKNENGLVLGLMQEALRRSRAQYAHIEDPTTAQTILRHPKSPMS